MADDHSIHFHGNVTNAQVGQMLTNRTNMVQRQAPGEKKKLLEQLHREVGKLIESEKGSKALSRHDQ
jgi:hypothetical protein